MSIFKKIALSCLLIISLFAINQCLAAAAGLSAKQARLTENSLPNLRVGVILEMPFAQNVDGHYSGVAIDLWERIARSNHWSYSYVPLSDNIDLELNKLNGNGNLDLIIGPISVTVERLEHEDFTRPFFLSSIGVIAKKHELNIMDVLRTFLSRNLLLSIMILLLSFIVYIHLLWYLERGKLEGVSTKYYSAFSKDIWQHLFKKGFSLPSTFAGRAISLIWIIFAAALITSINANYTAAMTVNLSQTNSKISTLEDLQQARVTGIAGQVNSEVAEKNGISIIKVKDFSQAMNFLLTGKADAVICDAPIGIEYLHLHAISDYVLSPLLLENDEFAFAVRLGSPIRHLIDLGITQLQDDDSIIQLCRRYIGNDANRCDL